MHAEVTLNSWRVNRESSFRVDNLVQGLGVLWPACWMLGTDFNGRNWPDCGEIDITEYIGKEPDLIMGPLHGPRYSGALGSSKWHQQSCNIAADYHTYAVAWQADLITSITNTG